MLKLLLGFSILLFSTSNVIGQCDTLNYFYYIDTICIGDTTTIPLVIGPSDSQLYSDTNNLFIPDGSGQNYTTSLSVSGNNGSLIQSNEEVKLCINMEHSFLGDLEIMLTSPNLVDINIVNAFNNFGLFPGGFGGGGNYLGGANDNSSSVGVCEQYCFEMSSSSLPAWNYGYNLVSATGPSIGSMVQPGNYLPEEDFSSLIGSPIDGNWTLTVRDNLGSDDGWICDWSLELGNSNYVGHWNTSVGLSDSTIANPIFYPSQPTTYQYYSENINGTCFDTLTIDFQLYNGTIPFNIVGSSSVNEFSTETYSTNYDSTLSYNWSITNGIIYNGQSTNQVDVQWYDAPEGTIELFTFNQCNQTSDTLNVGIGVSGINENNYQVSIFPNPTTDGKVYFKTNETIQKIETKNMLGHNLFTKVNPSNTSIDLSSLPNGNYIISFYNSKGISKNYKINLLK